MEKIPRTRCLRCNQEMKLMGIEKLQLGQAGLFMGMWSNILSGSLEVEVYICSRCGKIEFYTSENVDEDEEDESDKLRYKDQGKTIKCPYCGRSIDFNYPICPFCGHKH